MKLSLLVFHEMTKHIKVDCHFIREMEFFGCIVVNYIDRNGHLAAILTKSLRVPVLGSFVTSSVHIICILQLEERC